MQKLKWLLTVLFVVRVEFCWVELRGLGLVHAGFGWLLRLRVLLLEKFLGIELVLAKLTLTLRLWRSLGVSLEGKLLRLLVQRLWVELALRILRGRFGLVGVRIVRLVELLLRVKLSVIFSPCLTTVEVAPLV